MKHCVIDERARSIGLLSVVVGAFIYNVTYTIVWFLHVAAGPKKCTLNVFDRGENFGTCVCVCKNRAILQVFLV